MKILYILLLFAFVSCVNQQDNSKKENTAETSIGPDPEPNFDSAKSKEETILSLNQSVLTAIKNNDLKIFASFMHPILGTRFSPYGFIDTASDITLTPETFLQKMLKPQIMSWGAYDGEGGDIRMTIGDYFKKFVYDVDFLSPEKTSYNQTMGAGNSLNNITEIYKDADFMENYFSGFDKKYDGMDWRSLRLVFKEFEGNYYLVGVVHDQWTI